MVLTNKYGSTTGVVRVDDRVRPGVVSMTHGWIATNPTALMVMALGNVPCSACQTTVPITHRPNTPMVVPLASAAAAR